MTCKNIFGRDGTCQKQTSASILPIGLRSCNVLFRHFDSMQKDKKKTTRELTSVILARKSKMSNFLEWKGLKVVYKR